MKKTLSLICFVASAIVAHAQQTDTKTNPQATITEQVMRAVDTTMIYQAVEQPASFPGGDKSWSEYIQKNLKYPEKDKAEGSHGRVFVTFVVERDGSVSNPKVMRGIGGGCDVEAVRLLRNSPKWNPGMQNGQNVRLQHYAVVEFKL